MMLVFGYLHILIVNQAMCDIRICIVDGMQCVCEAQKKKEIEYKEEAN